MKKIVLFIALAAVMASCFPEDNPVQPITPGGLETGRLEMSRFYTQQFYYDLGSASVAGENYFGIWDLGFACEDGDYHIILNYAKFMRVYNTEEVNFESVDDSFLPGIAEDSLWKFDNPFGYEDSTAFGKWWVDDNGDIISNEHVFIVDLGKDEKTKPYGKKKLQLFGFQDGEYVLRVADLDGSNDTTFSVAKDVQYNYVNVSIRGEAVEIAQSEPPSDTWDLIFTKNTELLYTSEGDGVWYSVVSVLLNPKYVEADYIILDTVDVSGDFKKIDRSIIDTLDFKSTRNAIGHEWKYYDLDGTDSYVTFPRIVYIIKDDIGFYYKLHFIDFYDDKGNKGTPRFEFQRL
jgi:hypothetical protein